MKTRTGAHEHLRRLMAGDVFAVSAGLEHKAVRDEVARVLIIERQGEGGDSE